MDDLDQIARVALAPGVGVRIRAVESGRQCFISTENAATDIRGWMESIKAQTGETDFVVESVDKDASLVGTLWTGGV